MIYRSSESRAVCDLPQCRSERVEVQCKRCGRTFCIYHAPGPDHRCDVCEEVYDERRRRIRFWPVLAISAVPCLLFWLFITYRFHVDNMVPLNVGFLVAFIAALPTVFGAAGAAVGVRIMLTRIRFLSERSG